MAGWYGWKNGTTNCKEEQECEITSSLFTEPVEESVFYLKIKKILVTTSNSTDWENPERSLKNKFLEINFKFYKIRISKRFYLGQKYIHSVKYI